MEGQPDGAMRNLLDRNRRWLAGGSRHPERLAMNPAAAVRPALLLGGMLASAAFATVAAPVLKWQHGGCYSPWCETGR